MAADSSRKDTVAEPAIEIIDIHGRKSVLKLTPDATSFFVGRAEFARLNRGWPVMPLRTHVYNILSEFLPIHGSQGGSYLVNIIEGYASPCWPVLSTATPGFETFNTLESWIWNIPVHLLTSTQTAPYKSLSEQKPTGTTTSTISTPDVYYCYVEPPCFEFTLNEFHLLPDSPSIQLPNDNGTIMTYRTLNASYSTGHLCEDQHRCHNWLIMAINSDLMRKDKIRVKIDPAVVMKLYVPESYVRLDELKCGSVSDPLPHDKRGLIYPCHRGSLFVRVRLIKCPEGIRRLGTLFLEVMDHVLYD